MKKKIFVLLILSILFFNFDNVNAESDTSCKPVSPTFNGHAGTSVKIQIGDSERKGYFYRQSLNGTPALCLKMGGTSRSYYKFYGDDLDSSTYASYQKGIFSKAYNLIYSDPNNDTKLMVAQVAVWLTLQGELSLYNGTIWGQPFRTSIVSAYCSLNGYGTGKSSCLEGGVGYQRVEKEQGSLITNIIRTFRDTPLFNGTLYVYRTKDGSNPQPLLSMYGCKPDKKNYACSDGTKKTEMTACVKNNMTNGIAETDAYNSCFKQYCTIQTQQKCFYEVLEKGTPAKCNFTNTNNEGYFYEYVQKSCKNTANRYGAPEADSFVGGTCRLYCLESATQSFPGNVAPALSKGTILVWPTSTINTISLNKNIYPLSYVGKRTCKLIMDGTDDDIYYQGYGGPIYIYNFHYDNVMKYYNKYETVKGVTNTNVASFSHTQKTYDEIRTNYVKDDGVESSLDKNKSCGKYYKDASDALDKAIESAKESRTNWINSNKCSDTKWVGGCERWSGTRDERGNAVCAQCSSDGCTKHEKSVERTCTDDDYPYNNEIEALEDMKDEIKDSKEECETYVDNYVGMSDTYLRVASCNNKEIDINSLYDFQTDATVEFEGENGTETVVLNKISEKLECVTNNCKQNASKRLATSKWSISSLLFFTGNYNKSQFYNLVHSINDVGGSRERKIVIEANVTYSLPSGSVTESKGNGNYTKTSYSGFKILSESEVGKKYDLTIFNNVLGHKNKFGHLLSNDYVCNYEVTETPTTNCICPEGTDHAGKDLYCIISNSNETCVEAQIKYCDNPSIDIPDDCPETPIYCPNDPSIILTPCVNSGHTYEYCERLFCYPSGTPETPEPPGPDPDIPTPPNPPGPDPDIPTPPNPPGPSSNKYTCKNTNGVGGKMDITSCVYTKISQGLSVQKAIDECDALVCPIGGGIKIIYRTISLENPFPGKNITGGVSGFNTNVKGRYPGTNWNSINLVKNEIFYSRSNNQNSYGSKIYQNEEPLYTFILNSQTISAIRKYNDSNKYSDFKLDCKKNNSTACVSDFVHNANLSGLVGGTCQYNTSKTNFYKCSNDA